jgi:hypothetical protein
MYTVVSRLCKEDDDRRDGVDINWQGETKRCQQPKTKTGIWYSPRGMQLD